MTTADRTNGLRSIATQMTDAAAELIDNLDDVQRDRAFWPIGDTDERTRWFYTPTDHGGLSLAEMTGHQQRLTHRLAASGLSTAGYMTMAAIMGLENMLDHVEGWQVSYGRDRGRDPQLYYVSVFGEPGSTAWGWRFGGRHSALSYLIVDGELSGYTPCFLGADPASTPLLGPHLHRPLAGVEDLGRELVHALDDEQRTAALVSPVAPADLIGANRTQLTEGDQQLPLHLIWRGRFERELDQTMSELQVTMDQRLGMTEVHRRALAFSASPKGVSASALDSPQRQILRALLAQYVDRLPDAVADVEKATFEGSRIERLSFLWAGGIEAGQPHYYRIQGDDLLIEYDNTQRDVNHIHSVWRDLRNDFGRDALADHYASHHR